MSKETTELEDRVNNFAETVMGAARKNFERDGELSAIAMIPTKEATVFLSMDDFCSKFGLEAGKNMFGLAVRKMIAEYPEADMVGMVAETWTAELPAEIAEGNLRAFIDEMYLLHGESIADWPDEYKSEKLMISVESRQGLQVGYMIPIDSDTRELGEAEKIPMVGSGRFTNWFGGEPTPGGVQLE